jgi:ribosomal protein L25 (general stress protein Ctc)
MLGPIITSAMGMFGAGLQNQNQNAQANLQHSRSLQAMQYQNKWNLQQWRRNNRYNSPAAQMARFKKAGLNPHLIYGQGTPGNAQNISAAPYGGYSQPLQNNVLGNLAASAMAGDTITKSKAQLKNIRMHTAKMAAEIGLIENQSQMADLMYGKENVNVHIDKKAFEQQFPGLQPNGEGQKKDGSEYVSVQASQLIQYMDLNPKQFESEITDVYRQWKKEGYIKGIEGKDVYHFLNTASPEVKNAFYTAVAGSAILKIIK